MIEKGFCLADWLVKCQNNDGSWNETPDTWTGTSVFQLMALAGLTDTGRKFLSQERMTAYEKAIRKACEWVCQNIRFRMTTTNYVASGAAALILADKLFPEQKWQVKAGQMARLAAKKITRYGLVRGEGRGRRILKKIYIHPKGIDIGYGLEMTLGSLGLYSVLSKDHEIASLTLDAIKSHLFFIYPDGTLDNSLGSRGYKWTVYGSKTAHGSQMALAFGSLKDPEVNRALKLTVGALYKYINHGLLNDGTSTDSDSGLPCFYPSVVRAANLAFALAYFQNHNLPEKDIPSQKPLWFKYWKDLNSVTLKRDPWMATVSGYNELTRYPETGYTYYVPGGGSLTRLFHREWGDIQAGTQLDYCQIESLHVPFQNMEVPSFTPRIIIKTSSGIATNAHSRKTIIKCEQSMDQLKIQASGSFILPGKGKKLDSVFNIEYIFTENRLTKNFHINLRDLCQGLEIFEPVLTDFETQFQVQNHGILFSQNNKTLVFNIKGSTGIFIKNISQMHCPLPALTALPVIYQWDQPAKGEYTAVLNIDVKTNPQKEV
ncbi:Uncharacterized protein dnl_57330 [Desulfonema limicola]|uniref:Uncharacterized protein n=1 Tax=Desulfonema limicola TaxID=45656 RepID=A0A975BDI7_9BACT|nr:hypothetical protein [Desulfonema limicola]QTA83333.1 Uncharacterized protein dnl_57330 [Desulfonema limicola]